MDSQDVTFRVAHTGVEQVLDELLFLLIPAELLIITTDILMNATPFMLGLSVITIAGMTFGITSLGIGFGAWFPRFKVENVSQIPTGFGVCSI